MARPSRKIRAGVKFLSTLSLLRLLLSGLHKLTWSSWKLIRTHRWDHSKNRATGKLAKQASIGAKPSMKTAGTSGKTRGVCYQLRETPTAAAGGEQKKAHNCGDQSSKQDRSPRKPIRRPGAGRDHTEEVSAQGAVAIPTSHGVRSIPSCRFQNVANCPTSSQGHLKSILKFGATAFSPGAAVSPPSPPKTPPPSPPCRHARKRPDPHTPD